MRRTVSCITPFHLEGQIAHKTLLGFERARRSSEAAGVSVELVAVLDSADAETACIVRNHPVIRGADQIVEVQHRDLGDARNAGVQSATGEFCAMLDGDDYVSANWFGTALDRVLTAPVPVVVHPEYVVAYGRVDCVTRYLDFLEQPYPSLNCLKVHPWVSAVLARREVFLDTPYQRTDVRETGFGYEDWHWNLEVWAEQRIMHTLARRTALFYRTKPHSMLTDMDAMNAIIRPSKFFTSPDLWT